MKYIYKQGYDYKLVINILHTLLESSKEGYAALHS